MVDVRRYNPAQGRDPNGEWGDGVPGPSAASMSWPDVIDAYGQAYDEAEASDFTVAVFERGDFTLFYRNESDRYEPVRELDPDYAGELADRLDEFADIAASTELDDGEDESEDAADYVHIGTDSDALVGSTNSGQVIFSASKSGDREDDLHATGNEAADQFWMSPDDARGLAEAIRDMVERFEELDERARQVGEIRKYNASQQRDPNGEWGDGVPGAAPLKDALKLVGRIHLGPGEQLVGSGRVDSSQGGIRLAVTDTGGRRMVRFGAGGEQYGQRNSYTGTVAWDGNSSRPPMTDADRERLTAERDRLDDEWDSATPERQQEIEARQEAIDEELDADRFGFNGTANLDETSVRRVADRIRPALEEAIEQHRTEQNARAEIARLEEAGDYDDDRMAELRRIARADDLDYITFTEGIVAGSQWGDVHFAVEMDDDEPYVTLGVAPKGAPDDWGDALDWKGVFSPADMRKLFRLIDRATAGSSSRSQDLKGATVPLRSFQPEEHPRAPSGGDTGGQFAAGGGGQKKTPSKRRPHRQAAAANGTLAYDPSSGQGTGYDSKDGNPQVHELQDALNRLGVKDSQGKPLTKDGKLGPKTTSAVKALQQKLGVKADGKVTLELLKQIKSMKALPMKRSAFMDICVRSFGFELEARARGADDGRTLEGYAAVFNSPTRIAAVGGDFDEVIAPGAFRRSIRSRKPVLQFEHGRDPRIGAAPIGAIEDLSEDSTGLHVRARLFDHPDIERVRQGIAARAITGMSFRFQVTDGGDRWERRSGSVDLRTVGDADVHELGPVVFPAYDSTTVSVRSLLAQLGPEEHRTLLRELAYDLRSLEPEHIAGRPSARSSGGGDTDKDDGPAEEHLSTRQRLDQGALRSRGILK